MHTGFWPKVAYSGSDTVGLLVAHDRGTGKRAKTCCLLASRARTFCGDLKSMGI